MLKRFLFIIIIILFSISFWGIPKTSAREASAKDINPDIKYNYYDLLKMISLLKSMSVYYSTCLYPDTIYFGTNRTVVNHQDLFINTEMDTVLDTVLIDLKWQLNKDWFLGIYSELERKEQNSGNGIHYQLKDSLDTDFGIIFVHEF